MKTDNLLRNIKDGDSVRDMYGQRFCLIPVRTDILLGTCDDDILLGTCDDDILLGTCEDRDSVKDLRRHESV